jgi:hypothetical protein
VSRLGYLAFDRVGTWGHALLAVDDNGLMWSITANGTAKVIENFGVGTKPEGIDVAPLAFGGLGGYLLVCLERGGSPSVVAIPPNDTSKVLTIAPFPAEEPERVLTIQPNSDLSAAKLDGTVLRVPAANLTRYAGSLLVITEGDIFPTATMTVLNAAGGNVTATRLMEQDHAHFEGADFVPSGASQPFTSSSTGAAASGSVGGSDLSLTGPILIAVVAAVVIGAVALSIRRRRRA